MMDVTHLLEPIRSIHVRIRDAVVAACEKSAGEEMSRVVDDGEGDTIYAVDRVSDELLVEFFEREISTREPVVLIAEGLPGGQVTLPRGTSEESAAWRIIADPVDGTRGLMYQKRSGWILTGVAPNHGPETRLSDIELAVQTEIPLVKQHLSDTLWAVRGSGASAERWNRLTGQAQPLPLHPSTASGIEHGFATIARFFSGARDILAAIDDEISIAAVRAPQAGKAYCFEDQYISTGGQLYELMCGHDRFIADLRPLLHSVLRDRGQVTGLCCHPYDLSAELIARELGVILTDENGNALDADLRIDADVAWVGYANGRIREGVEPLLKQALRRWGLLP